MSGLRETYRKLNLDFFSGVAYTAVVNVDRPPFPNTFLFLIVACNGCPVSRYFVCLVLCVLVAGGSELGVGSLVFLNRRWWVDR